MRSRRGAGRSGLDEDQPAGRTDDQRHQQQRQRRQLHRQLVDRQRGHELWPAGAIQRRQLRRRLCRPGHLAKPHRPRRRAMVLPRPRLEQRRHKRLERHGLHHGTQSAGRAHPGQPGQQRPVQPQRQYHSLVEQRRQRDRVLCRGLGRAERGQQQQLDNGHELAGGATMGWRVPMAR